MTELDALTAHQPPVDPLDDAGRDRVRARVAELIRLGAADPLADGPAPGDLPFAAVVPLAPLPSRAPTRRLWLPLAAVAAAAAVLLLVAGLVWPPRDDGADVSTSTDSLTLDDLAAMARSQPDAPLGPREYHYQRSIVRGIGTSVRVTSTGTVGDGAAAYGETEIRNWLAADGTGRSYRSHMTLRDLETGITTLDPYGPSDQRSDEPGTNLTGGVAYEVLRSLDGRSAGALFTTMAVSGAFAMEGEGAAANRLAELMGSPAISPAVRAAAIEALGLVGGRLVGTVTDLDGRSGLAVVGPDLGGTSWMVLLDPTTGAELGYGSRLTLTDPPVAVPSDQSWYAFFESFVTTTTD